METNDDVCSVCLEEFSKPAIMHGDKVYHNTIAITRCGHQFHGQCIQSLTCCPLCRREPCNYPFYQDLWISYTQFKTKIEVRDPQKLPIKKCEDWMKEVISGDVGGFSISWNYHGIFKKGSSTPEEVDSPIKLNYLFDKEKLQWTTSYFSVSCDAIEDQVEQKRKIYDLPWDKFRQCVGSIPYEKQLTLEFKSSLIKPKGSWWVDPIGPKPVKVEALLLKTIDKGLIVELKEPCYLTYGRGPTCKIRFILLEKKFEGEYPYGYHVFNCEFQNGEQKMESFSGEFIGLYCVLMDDCFKVKVL